MSRSKTVAPLALGGIFPFFNDALTRIHGLSLEKLVPQCLRARCVNAAGKASTESSCLCCAVTLSFLLQVSNSC